MNTQAFIFWCMGDGRWVMEAEKVLEGEVTPEQILKDYGATIEKERPAIRVFTLGTATESDKKWILH